ncbi:MAG: recombinase family protein [Eubacteriales bacterium]
MIYGYVSFHEKGISKASSKEEQEQVLLKHYPSAKIIVENYKMPNERPILIESIDGMFGRDTIVVQSLDRLCGSVKGALDIIELAMKKAIRINILNLGIIDNGPSGKNIITVLEAILQFERVMMVERTQIGKAIAKEKTDFREGRPQKFSDEKIQQALSMLETMSYRKVEEELGISKSTLIRAKRKEMNG